MSGAKIRGFAPFLGPWLKKKPPDGPKNWQKIAFFMIFRKFELYFLCFRVETTFTEPIVSTLIKYKYIFNEKLHEIYLKAQKMPKMTKNMVIYANR